jgi:hypothetical protein
MAQCGPCCAGGHLTSPPMTDQRVTERKRLGLHQRSVTILACMI